MINAKVGDLVVSKPSGPVPWTVLKVYETHVVARSFDEFTTRIFFLDQIERFTGAKLMTPPDLYPDDREDG